MQLGSVLLLASLLSGYEGHLNMGFSKVRNTCPAEPRTPRELSTEENKGDKTQKLGSDEIARETSF